MNISDGFHHVSISSRFISPNEKLPNDPKIDLVVYGDDGKSGNCALIKSADQITSEVVGDILEPETTFQFKVITFLHLN